MVLKKLFRPQDTVKAIERRILQEPANGATQPAEIGKENSTHRLEKKPHQPSLEHSTSSEDTM